MRKLSDDELFGKNESSEDTEFKERKLRLKSEEKESVNRFMSDNLIRATSSQRRERERLQ
jgi:hypothetical protein